MASMVDVEAQPISTIGYGQLDKILVCQLGNNKIYRHLCTTELVLALITPCKKSFLRIYISHLCTDNAFRVFLRLQ